MCICITLYIYAYILTNVCIGFSLQKISKYQKFQTINKNQEINVKKLFATQIQDVGEGSFFDKLLDSLGLGDDIRIYVHMYRIESIDICMNK
jgi:hypothetical protein